MSHCHRMALSNLLIIYAQIYLDHTISNVWKEWEVIVGKQRLNNGPTARLVEHHFLGLLSYLQLSQIGLKQCINGSSSSGPCVRCQVLMLMTSHIRSISALLRDCNTETTILFTGALARVPGNIPHSQAVQPLLTTPEGRD